MIFPMIPPIMTPPEPPTTDDYRVFDIIAEYQRRKGQLPPLDIKDSENNTIADTADIFPLWIKYGDFIYSQSKLVVSVVENEPLGGGYIFAEWENFCARNADNLKRMIDALFSTYNPISNYDMIEKSVDGETLDEIETTPSGKTITKSYAAGLNSSGDGALTGKNETSFENAKSTTSPKNTKSVTLDSETLANVHKATQHILTRSGNIGVTTSAQMITQEIELRVVDLIDDFVKRFFDKYTRYVG